MLWEDDDEPTWYEGRVVGWGPARGHHICYDDGEQQQEALDECRCACPLAANGRDVWPRLAASRTRTGCPLTHAPLSHARVVSACARVLNVVLAMVVLFLFGVVLPAVAAVHEAGSARKPPCSIKPQPACQNEGTGSPEAGVATEQSQAAQTTALQRRASARQAGPEPARRLRRRGAARLGRGAGRLQLGCW